jgi:tRNA pseudouridine(54/55) synthase
MDLFESLEKQEINFCQICKNIIKLNIETESNSKEEYNPKNKKLIQVKLPPNEDLSKLEFNNNNDSYCFLCLNILDINHNKYTEILKDIKDLINQYDHNCIKLVLKFSSIFNFIFWFINTKISKIYNQNLNYIFKSDTIRQIFINKYTSFFSEKLEEKFDNNEYNRDLDLIINYDLNDKIYQKFNDIILSSINNNNKIDIKEIKEKYLLNKNTGRSIIKALTTEICDTNALFMNISKFFSIKEISSNININFSLSPTALYVSGNYIKLSREIGQNHFDRIFNISSVDEEIKKYFSKIFKNSENDDFIFSASGREDRNVRMLGSGRNFIYEIFNSKKKFGLNFDKIKEEFNCESKLVKIKNLKISSKSEYNKIKKEENAKIKKYLAVIYTSKKIEKDVINNLIKDNLDINQITPIRVLHQRAYKERKKQIISLKEIGKINDHFIIIEIIASAGTYIKEFINGDLGRTFPNLGSLLNCECDILQLDVEDIIF